MELRRRRRVQRRRMAGSYSSCVFAVCAVFSILTLFIAFSEPGTWIAKTVFQPLFSKKEENVSGKFSDSETRSEAEAENAAKQQTVSNVTKQVSIPSFTCYALQMGVFSEEANARNKALSLALQGAAGYVYADQGENYRALAAGYVSENSLSAVREQLKAEFIDSMPYEIQTPECVLSVSGPAETVEACRESAAFLTQLAETLLELSIRFDRDALSVAAGISELKNIRAEAAENAAALSTLPEESRLVLSPVIDCLEQSVSKMDELLHKQDAEKKAFSSALKYLSLMYVSDLEVAVKALAAKGG